MKTTDRLGSAIHWAARITSIAFALLLSIFSLDVFSEHDGFWKTILALCIHLIPSILVLLILLLSLHREWIGVFGYTALGIAYIVAGKGKMDWTAYLFIDGPLFMLAILFLIAWVQRKKHTNTDILKRQ